MRVRNFVHMLVLAVWLGGAVFLVTIAAPSAFAGAPSPSIAGDVVGEMLRRWHWIGVLAPLLLLTLDLQRRKLRGLMISILLVSAMLAAGQTAIDSLAHRTRRGSATEISSLPTGDPVRRRFGIFHAMSVLLLGGQIITATVYAAAHANRARDERQES